MVHFIPKLIPSCLSFDVFLKSFGCINTVMEEVLDFLIVEKVQMDEQFTEVKVSDQNSTEV